MDYSFPYYFLTYLGLNIEVHFPAPISTLPPSHPFHSQKCASNSIIGPLLLLSYINHPKGRTRAISDVVYDFQVASFLYRSFQEASSSFMAMKGYESLFFFSTTGGSTPHAVLGIMPIITSATGAEGAQLK